MRSEMLFACLAMGVMFGSGAAAITLINGGGLLLALLAYSSGGALSVLGIVAWLYFSNTDEDAPELVQTATA